MHFIKEIIQGDPDQEHIHLRFKRYGRGEFAGPSIGIKEKSGFLKINASDGYAEALGEILAGEDCVFEFSGNIISRDDLTDFLEGQKIEIEKAAKKKGVNNYTVKANASSQTLRGLYEKLKGALVFLDIKSAGGKEFLKTKKKPPKPGSGADAKFCSAVLESSKKEELIEKICFDLDKKDFREASILHTYVIEDLAVPEEYKKDPAKARIHAKRKGTLKRMIEVDGVKRENEYDLLV